MKQGKMSSVVLKVLPAPFFLLAHTCGRVGLGQSHGTVQSMAEVGGSCSQNTLPSPLYREHSRLHRLQESAELVQLHSKVITSPDNAASFSLVPYQLLPTRISLSCKNDFRTTPCSRLEKIHDDKK